MVSLLVLCFHLGEGSGRRLRDVMENLPSVGRHANLTSLASFRGLTTWGILCRQHTKEGSVAWIEQAFGASRGTVWYCIGSGGLALGSVLIDYQGEQQSEKSFILFAYRFTTVGNGMKGVQMLLVGPFLFGDLGVRLKMAPWQGLCRPISSGEGV